ncbi:hypothetical protein [Mycolicibacterium pulveris]|uniref:hypothetical protein n=1 Tax=Mycolicibacterium pulveris TaxID=36813 RepID=UPI003CF35D5A
MRPVPSAEIGEMAESSRTFPPKRPLGLPLLLLASLAAVMTPSPAYAEPAPPEPWPNIRFYDPADLTPYAFAGVDGVWFLAPTGQNCGIWGRGSFACSGQIPGAPPGTQALGWVTGDRAMHYDWSVPLRMPPTRAHTTLAPRTYIEHQGTTCAVTADAHTYCERGPLRFLITPDGSWLTPPWMDLPGR